MRKTIVRNRSNVKTNAAQFLDYIAALHRAVHGVGLFLDAATDGMLTQPEAIVLLYLSTHGASTINDVHRAFLHRRSTLTNVVGRLEERGLVVRSVGEADRRNFVIAMTARGRTSANRIGRGLEKLAASLAQQGAAWADGERVLDALATGALALAQG